MRDISDYYVGELAELEETNWYITLEYMRNYAQVKVALEENEIHRVIEVGCGSGLIPTELPSDILYLGVDKNPTFMEYARQKNAPTRLFEFEDVRNLGPDWLREKDYTPDLALSFAFLKHFGLHEWDDILKTILSLAPRAVFDVQVSDYDFDNGIDFHHVTVSRERLDRVIKKAGHKCVHDVLVLEEDVAEGPMQVRIITTAKV